MSCNATARNIAFLVKENLMNSVGQWKSGGWSSFHAWSTISGFMTLTCVHRFVFWNSWWHAALVGMNAVPNGASQYVSHWFSYQNAIGTIESIKFSSRVFCAIVICISQKFQVNHSTYKCFFDFTWRQHSSWACFEITLYQSQSIHSISSEWVW